MKDYKRYTSKDGATLTMSQWGGSPAELELYRKLAELEDKIENGTLIELPCKVGDTVYEICKDCSNCSHFKETGWEYDCWCDFDDEEHKTMFEVDGDNDCIYRIDEIKFEYNSIAKFGKTIFLTKAEAEAQARLRALQVLEIAENKLATYQKQLKELKGERLR